MLFLDLIHDQFGKIGPAGYVAAHDPLQCLHDCFRGRLSDVDRGPPPIDAERPSEVSCSETV